ncbi:LacI family DNA-binding transcriptional regulator [Jatrophihabitans telluris]|uniref:LacI family DNA-binding transcriptional regulator n=1 Tax=Jatrophihabitans telluris TaxID=2038343 RepID=A0ABY4R0B5_9ACTN|nr:LacI family DNA-binding transcriptional regulator [Jatrophihabitans telluris]UQX88952.1 LacI family DNA-binding transcriptional regulator [Jatrophihabitans telluris]
MSHDTNQSAATGHPRRPRRGRPGGTLAAVAAKVGVSRTTVSNAYNRPDQLSKDLRERIMGAAAELGYAGPDPVARSLRTRQADAVGLLFGERLGYAFRDPGTVEFMHGLGEACTERGRSLLLVPSPPGSASEGLVHRASVDGFVISSAAVDDPNVRAVLSRPQPAVIVDSPLGVAGVDFVGIEDRAGFAQVARHVLGLGHRRIGVLSIRRGEDVDAETSPRLLVERIEVGRAQHPVRQQRLLGLLDAAAELGIPSERFLVSERPYNSREEGVEGARELLAADSELTAIMSITDVMAIGVLDELSHRGVAVPAGLTVTGFDDVPAAQSFGLTTVRQPLEEKGRIAIETLLDDRPRTRAKRVLLPTELIVRASSAPPRS